MGSAWWQCATCLRAQEEDICELQLNHCNLYDVPPDVFIYERTLEKLYLDANRIKDLPRPLFQCHELRVLSLSDNEVTLLPPAIASLINLEHLDLSKNSLKELPDSIKECKNLRSIDLSVNPIERFPDPITYIVSLRELYINDAYLEYLPSNFGRLSALKTLEVRENNIITLPKSMSRLINLQRLDIGNNDFTELPEVVGDLINLTELWLDGNDIRRIPVNIEQLYRLNHFDCTMNAIHTVPSEIQGWRDIAIMNLSSNEIYQLPDSISYLRTIVTLKVDDNQLNSLPDDIGQMSNLEELIVTKNFLEYLPPSIGLLRKLHCLNADNNYLKSLPPELGSCTALSLLSLQSNNLSRIPPELGHLHSLRVFNLVNNCIKYLPVSMLNLNNLKALWLSDNQSQPLVPLQQEYNRDGDMMVLSCFMLPQKPREDIEPQTVGPISSSLIGTGKRICFSGELDSDAPRQLHRAPTPYPKELRNLARHARNLQNQPIIDPKNSHLPSTEHDVSNDMNKLNHDPTIKHVNSEESSEKIKKFNNSDEREIKFHNSDYLIRTPKIIKHVNSSNLKSEENTKVKKDKIIESEKCNSIGSDVETNKLNKVPLVPPPYHIAAAFSKKAAFFQRFNTDENSDSHSNVSVQMSGVTSLESQSQNSEDNLESKKNEDTGLESHERDIIEENGSTNNSLSPVEIPNDEQIYDNDRSIKPSRIPILKTKHLEHIDTSTKSVVNSLEEWETKKLWNLSTIPTSPITGKKYRTPMSMQLKISDKSKNLMNGNIIDSDISLDDSLMNVSSLDQSSVTKVPVSPGKNSIDNSIKSDTNSGRSTPVSSNSSSKLSSNIYVDNRKCKIPVINDHSSPDKKSQFKWMFGPHRNANVLSVNVRKNPGLGFSIAGGVAGAETGIIVTKVNPDGPAQGLLRPGDKILEVDGIDFTKSDHNNAVAVLRATGSVVSMMISRHQ